MDDKLKKVIERIKKCLALAQSDNPNEAATAMRQAQKLMREYNLTESSLHTSNVTENKIKFGKGARQAPEWMNKLAGACAFAFDCQVIFQANRFFNEKYVNYIGLGEAPKMAEYCYEVLARQLEHARKEYCKKLKAELGYIDRVATNNFALGWVIAIRSKLEELKPKTDQCDEPAGNNALVKVSDSIIDDYIKNIFGDIPEMKDSKASRDNKALVAGYDEGEKANLYQPMNGNTETTPLLTSN